MKKSKTKSLYNKKTKIISITIFIVSIIFTIINTSSPPKSIYHKYENKNTSLTGTIIECQKSSHTKLVINAKEKIIINYYKNFKCNLGQKIKVTGKIQKPNTFNNFNLFNYQKYLYSKKISYILNAESIKIIDRRQSFPYKIKQNIINHLSSYKSHNYLNTFVLGNTKDLDEKVITSYQNNGISHLFAISGMHITLLSLIILFIINHISKNKKLNYFVTYLFMIFYAFITSFTPSVVRAVTLFIALTITKKIKSIYLLIILCSINLFINPYIIYNIGFLLSYTTTFYLVLFSKTINKCKNYFNKTLIISIIASLASMPILIKNFFQINLLTPVINIIFVPLVSFIIYPFAIITAILKPLDTLFLTLIKLMENLSLILNNITVFTITLKHINIFSIIFYYILITYILYKMAKKQYRQIILLIIVLILHTNINYLNKYPSLTILDVGQGDSALIQFPNSKKSILIDTGGLTSFNNKKPYNLAKNVIIPYLKSQGINKINYLILTHGDYDHMGEAINLTNNFKVDKVIFNCGSYNDLEKRLIKVLDKKKIKYYSCIKKLNIDNHKLYFLQTKEYDNENDNSNVIYTELNGYKFMLMGDASSATEKEIMNKYNLSDIDVLKVGHHGSKTSSNEKFISEINPKYSVISVGKNNRYGHPNKEVLENLNNSKIYRTDEDGSIMFKIKNYKLRIETNPQARVIITQKIQIERINQIE